jgi:hypothetical protein
MNRPDTYDVIFHLFGEQRLPNYMGVKQFSCKRHIFIISDRYSASSIKPFIGDAQFEEIIVDPYNPKDIKTKIMDKVRSFGKELTVGFNLTSGTKLMFAGALDACKECGGVPFYFNTVGGELIYLDTYETQPIRPIESVEAFLIVNSNNLDVMESGRMEKESKDLQNCTDMMWKYRSDVKFINEQLAKSGTPTDEITFQSGCIKTGINRELEPFIRFDSSEQDTTVLFTDVISYKKYISGGWLEEYVYNHLYTLYEAGRIRDIRIGLKLEVKNNGRTDMATMPVGKPLNVGIPYQEMDTVFTDGRRLYIVECKTQKITIDQITKLQNIVHFYGGVEGRGILLSSIKCDSLLLLKKAEDFGNMIIVSGREVPGFLASGNILIK